MHFKFESLLNGKCTLELKLLDVCSPKMFPTQEKTMSDRVDVLFRRLPTELLANVVRCGSLSVQELKNIRLVNHFFSDTAGFKLFETFKLNLNDSTHVLLAINAHIELHPEDADGDRYDQVMRTMPSKTRKKMQKSGHSDAEINELWKRQHKSKDARCFTIARFIRNLTVKASGLHANYRNDLLSFGLGSFLSMMPKIADVSLEIQVYMLSSVVWTKFLESTNPRIHRGRQQWKLNIDLIPDSMGYSKDLNSDFQNLQVFRNVRDFKFQDILYATSGGWRMNKAGRICKGLGSIIDHSPNLNSMDLHYRFGYCFSFDNVMSHVSQKSPTELKSLTLSGVLCPIEDHSMQRLKFLKVLRLFAYKNSDWRPKYMVNFFNPRDRFNNFWRHMRGNGSFLTTIVLEEGVCDEFISYLREAQPIGTLKMLHLVGAYAKESESISDLLALDFWNAIIPHAASIVDLRIVSNYGGEWCWSPNSGAATALALFSNIGTLGICLRDPSTLSSLPQPHSHRYHAGGRTIEKLLASLESLPKLLDVDLLCLQSYLDPWKWQYRMWGRCDDGFLPVYRELYLPEVPKTVGFVVKIRDSLRELCNPQHPDPYSMYKCGPSKTSGMWGPLQGPCDVWEFVQFGHLEHVQRCHICVST